MKIRGKINLKKDCFGEIKETKISVSGSENADIIKQKNLKTGIKMAKNE